MMMDDAMQADMQLICEWDNDTMMAAGDVFYNWMDNMMMDMYDDMYEDDFDPMDMMPDMQTM